MRVPDAANKQRPAERRAFLVLVEPGGIEPAAISLICQPECGERTVLDYDEMR